MVATPWKVTRRSIVINCFRHACFKAPATETVSGSGSPEHDHEEAAPSFCKQIHQLNEVAAELSFENFLSANADEDTTEALDDEYGIA